MSKENSVTYISEHMAKRRYYIFQSWSAAKSAGYGRPTPKEVSKVWYYWCKLRRWRYQPNYDGSFLVKINKWTRQYHFQDNWEHPTDTEIWDGVLNTFAQFSSRGKS